MKRFLLFILISVFVSLPFLGLAQDAVSQQTNFNIEAAQDLYQRTEISAILIKVSPTAYWYVDKSWWQDLAAKEQGAIEQSLNSLSEEFEDNIHPNLTRTFGSEWTPGIDKDTRVTILIHPMKKTSGGYSDTSDEYPKIQIPNSNEREMIYLNSQYIGDSNKARVFLAHELMHLITFNQKDKINNIPEDVWLNEARADYSATFLGYDKNYEGSNLQQRVRDFWEKPSDSLTEWREIAADYGAANLFIQYLVDHYGINILVDSLKIKKTGIDSLNFVLSQGGFKTDFAKIFTDWTVALLLNDCQLSEKYCYYNANLKNFRITPLINYLPFTGQSTLSVTNSTKDWSGNWHRFVGGQGTLTVQFKVNKGVIFKVPYIMQDLEGNYSLENLLINEMGGGEIIIDDFGAKYASLTIIPLAQNKISGFSGIQPSYSFFWSASTKEQTLEEPPAKPIINTEKEKQIAVLKAQIMAIQLKIIELLKQLIQLLLTELSSSANM